jgi:large subunit ribosomal protein L21
MYAIIETGGKQYRVELGSVLEVERLAAEPGHEVVLDRVLLVADGDATAVGRPIVAGAEVHASVVRQDRGDKIVVFKYKAKTRHRTKRGHRQELTVLRVADIIHEGRSAAKVAAAEAKESDAEREKAAAEAAAQAARDATLAAQLAERAKPAVEEPARGRRAGAKAKAKPKAKAAAEPKTKAAPKTTAASKTDATTTKPAAKARAPRAKKEG